MGHSVSAPRIDDDGPDTLPVSSPKHFPTDCYRGRLNIVRCKDSSSRTWLIGCDKCEVRNWYVEWFYLGWFYTDMSAGYIESFGVCARCGDKSLLRIGNGAVD